MVHVVLKILVLLLSIFPVWMTFWAWADEAPLMNAWKDRINSALLSIEERKIQVVELMPTREKISDLDLGAEMRIDISEIRSQGISFIVMEFIDSEGRLSKRVRLPARVIIQDLVPVASKKIARGGILTSEDLSMEWRDAGQLRGTVSQAADLVGRQVNQTIENGQIISNTSLRRELFVEKGDRVVIRVSAEGIRLTAVGIAQEDGTLGQTIRIKNPDSKREFVATVKDRKEVEVSL